MTTTINSIAKNRTSTKTSVNTRAEVAKGAMVSINAAGVVIGMWSFASLISGVVVVGGPVSLARAWFGAVTGM